ncbi:MAG: hypothetical protein ACOCVE_04330, partial [Desulfovermiculus sp.]
LVANCWSVVSAGLIGRSACLALLPKEIQSDIQFFGQLIWQKLLFPEDIESQGQPSCIARLFRVRNEQP